MRYLSVGLFVYCLFLSGGCRAPGTISINPPPLTGDYEGAYRVTHNWGDSASAFTNWNYILWSFDNDHYSFRIDSARHSGHCFCTVKGQYTLGEGIYFQSISAVVDTGAGCSECDESEAPAGEFVRETKGDSLIFGQLVDSVYKELRLLRVK